MHLVYYYEPVDQYIHFALNGLPVHDQHYFDDEAAFFSGDDEAVDRKDGVELTHGSDGGNENEKLEAGNENGKAGTCVDSKAEDEAVGAEGSSGFSMYDYEWDLYQPFVVVEQCSVDWKGGDCDEDFSLTAASSVVEDWTPEIGEWQEEWVVFFT